MLTKKWAKKGQKGNQKGPKSIVSTPPVLTGGVGKSEKVLNWGGPGFSKIAGGDA